MKLEIEFFSTKEKLPENGRDVIMLWQYERYVSTKESSFTNGHFLSVKEYKLSQPDYWAYKPNYNELLKT